MSITDTDPHGGMVWTGTAHGYPNRCPKVIPDEARPVSLVSSAPRYAVVDTGNGDRASDLGLPQATDPGKRGRYLPRNDRFPRPDRARLNQRKRTRSCRALTNLLPRWTDGALGAPPSAQGTAARSA